MVFGFEEILYHECFEGGTKFSLIEDFCEFSNVFSEVSEVFSEVEDGVGVGRDSSMCCWDGMGVSRLRAGPLLFGGRLRECLWGGGQRETL
jgi:hypothetical protein